MITKQFNVLYSICLGHVNGIEGADTSFMATTPALGTANIQSTPRISTTDAVERNTLPLSIQYIAAAQRTSHSFSGNPCSNQCYPKSLVKSNMNILNPTVSCSNQGSSCATVDLSLEFESIQLDWLDGRIDKLSLKTVHTSSLQAGAIVLIIIKCSAGTLQSFYGFSLKTNDENASLLIIGTSLVSVQRNMLISLDKRFEYEHNKVIYQIHDKSGNVVLYRYHSYKFLEKVVADTYPVELFRITSPSNGVHFDLNYDRLHVDNLLKEFPACNWFDQHLSPITFTKSCPTVSTATQTELIENTWPSEYSQENLSQRPSLNVSVSSNMLSSPENMTNCVSLNNATLATVLPSHAMCSTAGPSLVLSSTATTMQKMSSAVTPLQTMSSTVKPIQAMSSMATPLQTMSSTATPLQSMSNTTSPIQALFSTATPTQALFSTLTPIQCLSSTASPELAASTVSSSIPAMSSSAFPMITMSNNAPLFIILPKVDAPLEPMSIDTSQVNAMSTALQSNAMSTALQSNAMSTALQSNAISTALQSNAKSTALQSNAMSTALQSNSMSTALQSNAMYTALQSTAMSTALQSNAMSAAFQRNAMSTPLQSNAMSTPLQSNAMSTALQNNAMSAALQSNAIPTALQSNAMSTALRSNAMSTALQSNAMSTALQSNAMSTAVQSNAMSTALQSNAMSTGLQSNAMSAALQSNAMSAALQSNAMSPALQSNAKSTALQSNAMSTALQSNAISTALKSNAMSAALQSNAMSTALQSNAMSTALQSNAMSTALQSNAIPAAAPIIIPTSVAAPKMIAMITGVVPARSVASGSAPTSVMSTSTSVPPLLAVSSVAPLVKEISTAIPFTKEMSKAVPLNKETSAAPTLTHEISTNTQPIKKIYTAAPAIQEVFAASPPIKGIFSAPIPTLEMSSKSLPTRKTIVKSLSGEDTLAKLTPVIGAPMKSVFVDAFDESVSVDAFDEPMSCEDSINELLAVDDMFGHFSDAEEDPLADSLKLLPPNDYMMTIPATTKHQISLDAVPTVPTSKSVMHELTSYNTIETLEKASANNFSVDKIIAKSNISTTSIDNHPISTENSSDVVDVSQVSSVKHEFAAFVVDGLQCLSPTEDANQSESEADASPCPWLQPQLAPLLKGKSIHLSVSAYKCKYFVLPTFDIVFYAIFSP